MMQGNEKKCLRIEESNDAAGRPLTERGSQEGEDKRAHGNQTRREKPPHVGVIYSVPVVSR